MRVFASACARLMVLLFEGLVSMSVTWSRRGSKKWGSRVLVFWRMSCLLTSSAPAKPDPAERRADCRQFHREPSHREAYATYIYTFTYIYIYAWLYTCVCMYVYKHASTQT